jgi:hypothetical protein
MKPNEFWGPPYLLVRGFGGLGCSILAIGLGIAAGIIGDGLFGLVAGVLYGLYAWKRLGARTRVVDGTVELRRLFRTHRFRSDQVVGITVKRRIDVRAPKIILNDGRSFLVPEANGSRYERFAFLFGPIDNPERLAGLIGCPVYGPTTAPASRVR